MKKIIAFIMALCLFSNIAFAGNDCDWSTIKKNPDNSYTYSAKLNLCVGQLVQNNQVQAQQIQDYQKAVSLKNLSIKYDDERVTLWQKSADDELSNLNKMELEQKHNDTLYFILGLATAIGAGFAISRVNRN